LQLESLEERAVMNSTYLVADFPGHGVYLYNPYNQNWQGLTSLNASKLAVDTGGDVVADFPGRGVWVWNNNSYSASHGWHQWMGMDASAIAIAGLGGFTVAASFPHAGVYEMTNGGSSQCLTTLPASLLGVDASGDVVADFPGRGVWLHPAYQSWVGLTGTDASAISMGEPYIAAEFPGHGVFLFDMNTSIWTGLTGANASAVSVSGEGRVVASFQSYGICTYYDGQWESTQAPASAQVGGNTTEVDALYSSGIWQYDCGTDQWKCLISTHADVMACAD